MFTRVPLAGAIVAAAIAFASVAQAATFNIIGGSDYTLPTSGGVYDPYPATPGLGAGATVRHNAVLELTGPGRVTFTLMGYEAGDTNEFRVSDALVFTNKGGAQAPFTLDLGAGNLPLAFRHVPSGASAVNGEPTKGFHPSIALFRLSDTSVYALFNDGYTGDKDYDDMIVRVDVSQVPLPAAAWLLIAGLGGLGLASRRRNPA